MNYWLVKSEPNAYSWQDLQKKGRDSWDGVRNYQARNNLKLMKEGDLVLFYHSVKEKAIVGVAKVVGLFYQDPTTENKNWVAVDLIPERTLKKPVILDIIKNDIRLQEMALLKQPRLSVMPVMEVEYKTIISLSEA